jgi:serine protease Do
VATVGLTHQTPVKIETAHAAALADQIPFGSFAPIVKRAMPAVVNISSSKIVKTSAQQFPGMDDPFFRQFFGGRMPRGQQPKAEKSTSLGSGVIVTKDGYILTNNHVVEGATEVKVSFSDKREFPAKVVGADKYTDVAVLKIDQTDLPTLAFANTTPQVGDLTLAIGNPFGLGGTVTMGIVSATGRTGLGIERYEDFIQTDAAINPGNSGGALINAQGELVGVNTAILSGQSGGNQGIGFAIPVKLARNVMDQLVKTGRVSRGYIGVSLQSVDPELARGFGLEPNTRGVAITSVEPKSPGAKAGLQAGDVITSVNGTPVEERGQLQLQVASMTPGTTVNLKIFRSGSYKDVSLTLAEFPKNLLAGKGGDDDQDDQPGANIPGEKGSMKGVSVEGINAEIRQQLQLPASAKGVVVTEVDDDSVAAREGLKPGDVIVQVNRKPVNSVSEFNSAVSQGGSGSTLLLVNRGGVTNFIAIPNK